MPTRPPLNALHVFCTVVREGGFRPAAQALCVTPGAVSRQIHALEAHLSLLLFERGSGGKSLLTPAGRRLHEAVAEKMAGIAAALESEAGGAKSASILVDTSVTLAMYWLIPQLRAFSQLHPHIHVRVRTGDGDIDPSAPVDVFIRRDPAELRGLPSKEFLIERSVLVASPVFVSQHGLKEDRAPHRLANAPIIGTRSRPDLWQRWNEADGAAAEGIAVPALEFDNTVLAIQATVEGLGISVVPEMFVDSMLKSGTLERISPRKVTTGSYSYALGRKRDSARVTAFTSWLSSLK